MAREGTLRAKVGSMIFTKVPATKNEPHLSAAGVQSSFTPTAVMSDQMDSLARKTWTILQTHPEYKGIFVDAEVERDFVSNTFRTFKMVPDLARNISVSNGVPIIVMHSGNYTTVSGISGQTSKAALEALQKEMTTLV